jgi:sporulation-control protein spo0M
VCRALIAVCTRLDVTMAIAEADADDLFIAFSKLAAQLLLTLPALCVRCCCCAGPCTLLKTLSTSSG